MRVFRELHTRTRSTFDAHKFSARLGKGMNLRFTKNILGLNQSKVTKMFQTT